MLHIINGHPDKLTKNEKEDSTSSEGTTTSSFILPFRYKITPLKNQQQPDLFYEQSKTNDNNDQWTERKRYFTKETSCVLFEHAKRFQINDLDEWQNCDENNYHPKTIEFKARTLHSDKKAPVYRVRVEAPEIILFEYQGADTKKENYNQFHTGFLIVRTYFCDDENLPPTKYEHLLHFNERFRYWRKNYTQHQEEMRELRNLIGSRSYVSDDDIRKLNKGQISEEEKARINNDLLEESLEIYLRRWQRLLTIPFKETDNKRKDKFYQFIPETYCTQAEVWFRDEISPKSNGNNDMGWIIYNDTRAFTCSNIVIENGAKALEQFNENKSIITEPESFGHLVKFLNVDSVAADDLWLHENKYLKDATSFEENWAKEKIYKRWAHYGTLYGFNYHAFVMLSPPSANPPLSKTFQRHYFDMIVLLLYLRISIFRFSNALNENTVPALKKEDNHKWELEFLNLRKEFAFFTNLYQFPLISNQQQMLEMYQLARDNLDIDELFKEVENEIKNTHEYFSAEKTNSLNKKITFLTIVGTVFAFLSVLGTLALFPWQSVVNAFKCFFS